uniref:Uncharacterized protein n=1 Tax=Cannabis sativa TaxID=3483 RepID=A0A803NJQ0_CANSA
MRLSLSYMIDVGPTGGEATPPTSALYVVVTLRGHVEAPPNSGIPSEAEQFLSVPPIPLTLVHLESDHAALRLARYNLVVDAQTKGSAEADVLKWWINKYQDAALRGEYTGEATCEEAAVEVGCFSKNLIDQSYATTIGSQVAGEMLAELEKARKDVEDLKDNVLVEKTLRERDEKKVTNLENSLKGSNKFVPSLNFLLDPEEVYKRLWEKNKELEVALQEKIGGLRLLLLASPRQ